MTQIAAQAPQAAQATQAAEQVAARIAWAGRIQGRRERVHWTQAEIDKLHEMAGRKSLVQIARELGRGRNSVASKLMNLGYRIKADVNGRVGMNARELAEHLNANYEQVWRDIRAGLIGSAYKEGGKDYMVPWRGVRQYERHLARIKAKRERVLKRIKVETISKQEFMKLIGLKETHATRYLQGGIVKAWKVPTVWTDTAKARWEWAVSKQDAERAAKLRTDGRLRLRKKAYRKITQAASALVVQMRRDRRLGKRAAIGPRSAVVPGHYSIAQIAQLCDISAQQVYEHVRLGRLAAVSVKVGKRSFLAVSEEVFQAYHEWCSRAVKATGPIHPWHIRVDDIHAAGRITAPEAAELAKVHRLTIRNAARDGRLAFKRYGTMMAFLPADVEAFAAAVRRFRKPQTPN